MVWVLGGSPAGGIDPSSNTIVLVGVQAPNVTDAMHGIRGELMARCYDQASAKALVASALSSAGLATSDIVTDGPLGYPIGQKDEAVQHVASGCYVFSGSGVERTVFPCIS